jgi:glycosyltransferase involved in cell wall biosynthesis
MKIALISESPSVATGFGVNCGHLTKLLAELRQEVVCFGVCALGQPFDPARYPCRIVPMPRDQRDALEFLPAFLRDEQPDVVFIHYDIAAVCRFVEAARAGGWAGPIITHVVIDGIPTGEEYLAVLRTVTVSITPTHTAANYLRSCGIAQVIAAPHPVNPEVFRALSDREELRRGAGLAGRFVVGVFGRNVERKQQPRVMLAIQQLKRAGLAGGILLYLHCQPKREDPWLNSWDLESVARQLDIADQVLFPQVDFQQLVGIPYDRQPGTAEIAPTTAGAPPAFPASYSYVERLNCCDMIVNAPYSGAFELVALEGQSCGVPVAVTNDAGPMAEVVGESAVLLNPIDVGIHSSGGRQHFVAARTIAEAILRLQGDPELRTALIRKGFDNAARYTMEPLRQALTQVVALVGPMNT